MERDSVLLCQRLFTDNDNWKLLRRLFYSLDLTSLDFHLFRPLLK